MPRLYRPYVPLAVRVLVAEQQLTEVSRLAAPTTPVGVRLAWLLEVLARKIGCAVANLRLDHDPPLAARPKFRRGLGKKTHYVPPANSPDHLLYRPHGAEFEGSHLVKTNVRGDHGQHPDRVLIKKERRRTRAKTVKRIKRRARFGRKVKCPLRSANRWPPKGSRKIGGKS